MNNSNHHFGLIPAELRKLASLRNPHGIQRFIDDMPYHLADTAWSPRRVLCENTAHCFEGAMLGAAALRANGFPPLILDLEGSLGSHRQVQLHWLPLSRTGLPHSSRAGAELFRRIFQFAPRALAADVFPSGESRSLRFSRLDDHRQASVVRRALPVRHSPLSFAAARHG